jgi:hypothetical protein
VNKNINAKKTCEIWEVGRRYEETCKLIYNEEGVVTQHEILIKSLMIKEVYTSLILSPLYRTVNFKMP